MNATDLYLTIEKDETRSLPRFKSFRLFTTLDTAREGPREEPTGTADTNAPKEEEDSAFADLFVETARELETFKSLDTVLGFLDHSKDAVQFGLTIKPTLEKFTKLVEKSEEKEIYSFDRTHSSEIVRAIHRYRHARLAYAQFQTLSIIGLVSAYDVILQKLIRVGLKSEDKHTLNLERNISLRDLKSFSTIDEATDFLIEREIDSILQKDHLEQLKELNRIFSLQIDLKDDCVKTFLEICERRNLFTHNAGIVNQRYLSKCSNYGHNVEGLKSGTRLRVNSRYFTKAVSVVDELCVKLIQYVWRHLLPKERERADSELNQHAYRLIVEEEYALAERILHYALHHTGTATDKIRRMMLVNYANAIKLKGDKDRALKELHKTDWSASDVNFRVSVAAIEDDKEEVLKLMKTMEGAMKSQEFREWPVFRPLRSDIDFQATFKKVFTEELIVAPSQEEPEARDAHSSPAKQLDADQEALDSDIGDVDADRAGKTLN